MLVVLPSCCQLFVWGQRRYHIYMTVPIVRQIYDYGWLVPAAALDLVRRPAGVESKQCWQWSSNDLAAVVAAVKVQACWRGVVARGRLALLSSVKAVSRQVFSKLSSNFGRDRNDLPTHLSSTLKHKAFKKKTLFRDVWKSQPRPPTHRPLPHSMVE